MLLVINDTHAVCAQCGTLRRQPGQTTWAALREHGEKGCTWLQQMAHRYRGECLQARGRWLLSGVSQCKPDGSEIYFVLGLTQEQFDRLLEVQGHACAMCHEPFDGGQLIHVDHDHACCQKRNRSCGKCVRGLLCRGCNIALGHIERRYDLARTYLDSPAWQLVARAA
jgi:Recombination endonuclease VII